MTSLIMMGSSREWMRSSRLLNESSRVWMRSSHLVDEIYNRMWIRSGRVVDEIWLERLAVNANVATVRSQCLQTQWNLWTASVDPLTSPPPPHALRNGGRPETRVIEWARPAVGRSDEHPITLSSVHCIKSELYLAKWKWILRSGPKLKMLVKFHCSNGSFPNLLNWWRIRFCCTALDQCYWNIENWFANWKSTSHFPPPPQHKREIQFCAHREIRPLVTRLQSWASDHWTTPALIKWMSGRG